MATCLLDSGIAPNDNLRPQFALVDELKRDGQLRTDL